MATPNIVTSSTIIQRSLFTPTMKDHGEMMLGQDANMPGLHVDSEWHRGQEVLSPRASLSDLWPRPGLSSVGGGPGEEEAKPPSSSLFGFLVFLPVLPAGSCWEAI